MENFTGKTTAMAGETEPEKTQQLTQAVLIKPGRTGGQNVTPFTRRNFLTTYPAAGVGLGLLAKDARAQNGGGGSSITSNFNGTAIPAGDWIWFTAVLKVSGLGSAPVTIGFMGSIQFSVNGTLYVVAVPSAFVTFSPSASLATTVFSNGQWITTVPSSGLAGSVFFDGVAVQSPSPSGFPGGINPVTWQGTFFSMTPGISLQWQWAAAVYDSASLGSDYTLLGVKPVDDNKASVY